MKTFIFALALVSVSTAATAQFLSPIVPTPFIPKTVELRDPNGKTVGTGTLVGRRLVMRGINGELIGTAIFERDGKKTFYDPSGNVVSSLSIPTPTIEPDDDSK
jgi:hypothetical protein